MIMAQVARAQAVIDLIVNDKGVAEQIKRTFEDAERKVAANGEVFQLKVDDSDFIDKFKKIKEISGNGNKVIIDFDDTSFKNAFGSASKEMQNSMTILRDFIVDIVKVFNGNGGFSNNFGEVRKLYDKIIKEEDKLAKIDRDNLKESFKSYKKNGSEENRNKFMAAYEEYFENTPSDDKNFKFTYNKKKYSFDDLKKEYNSLDDSFASLGVSGDVLDSIIDPIKESFRTAKRELENEIADLKNQAKNIINPVKTEENKTDGNGNGDYSNINIAPANLDEFYEKIEQHGTAKIAIKPANLEEFYDDIDEYQSKNGSAISKKDKGVYKDVVKLMKDYKDLSPEDLNNEQRKLLNEAMKGTDTPLSNDQVKQLVALRELYKKKGVDSNAFKPSKYLLNAGRDDFDNIMPGYSDIKESFENTAKKYVNAGTIPVKVTPLNLNSFFDKLKTEAEKKEIGINVTVDNVNTSNVSSNIAENTRELQEQEKLLKKISYLDDIIEKGDINVLDNFDENGKLTSKYINEKDLTSSKKTVTKKSIDKLIKSFNPESSSEEDIKKIASYLSAYKNPDNLRESSFKDNKGLWQRVNFIIDNAKNSLNAYAEKEKLLTEHSKELNDIIENNKKQNINNANGVNKQKYTSVIEQDTSPAPKENEEPIEKSVIFKTSFDETSIESLKGSAKTLKQDIEKLVSPIEVSFKESSVNNLASVIGEELSKLKIPSGSKNAKEEDFKEENNKTKKEKTFEEKFIEEHRQGDLNYLRNVFSDVFGISPSSRNQRVVDKISLKREDNIYPISRKREAAMLPQPLEAYIQYKYGYTDSERKKVLNNTGKGYTPKYGLVEDLLNTYKKEKGNLSNVKSNGNNNYRSDADMLKAALASAVEYYPNKDSLKNTLFKDEQDLFNELNKIIEQSSMIFNAKQDIAKGLSEFNSSNRPLDNARLFTSEGKILNIYDYIQNCFLNSKDEVLKKNFSNFDFERYKKEKEDSGKQKPKAEPKKTEKIEAELPDNNSDLTSGLKDIEATISNVVNGIRNITQEYNTSVSSIQGGIEEQKKSIESIGDSVEKALKSIEPLNKGMEETASSYKKTIEEANQISEGLEKRIKAFEEYQKEKAKFEKEIQKSEEEYDKKEGTTSNKSSKNREQKESYYDKTVKKIKDGFDKTTFAKDNIYALDENSFEEMANGTVKFVAELKLANNEVERLVFNVGEADSILTKNGSIRKDFLKNSGVLEKQPEISIVSEQEENKIKETAIEIDGLENKVDELKKIASNTSGFNIIDEDKLKEDEDGFVRFSATVADTKGKLKELYFEVQDLTHIAKQDGGFTTTFKNSGLTKETIEKNKAKSDKKNLEISQKEALEQLKNASISSDFFNLKSSKFDNSGFLTFIGYLEDADGKVKELSYSAKELKDVLNSDGTLNENFIKEGNITKLEEILEKFKVQLAENKTNEALGVEDEEGIKNASRLEADFKTNVDSANLSLEKQQELLLKFSQIKASHVEKFDLEDKKNGSARNKANKTLTNYENILEHVGYTGNEETNYENLNKDLHLYDKVQGKVVTLKEKMDALKNSADALFDSINGGKFADNGAFENAVRELQQKSSEMNKIANNQAYQNVNNKGESYDGTLFKNKNLKLIPVEEVKKAIKKKYENDYEFLDDIDYDPVKGTAKATVKNNGNIEKMTISLTSLESAAGKTEVAIHKLNVVQGEYLSTGAKWKNAIKGKIASLIQYVSGLSLVMGAYNKFREGFAFVREFDASLTTINQTMDISTSQLQKLGSSSINVGKQLGSTAQDVLGAVSIYANANETADSILEKSKPTVMLSNASGGDVSEASDQIQAVTQQFDELEGQERRIVNSYEKISSNVAMDFKKGIGVIAEGTQNAGSVAKESGRLHA